MLPASVIKSIIKERENQNLVAVAEVSEKCAGSQEINGPTFTIPVTYSKMAGKRNGSLLRTGTYYLRI